MPTSDELALNYQGADISCVGVEAGNYYTSIDACAIVSKRDMEACISDLEDRIISIETPAYEKSQKPHKYEINRRFGFL